MNIILFGPPGAGKGTQSDKLIDRYRLKHLSTGDLFRMHLGNKTHLGIEAKKFIEELGNPFKKIGVDTTGRSAIDLGVYGVPETYIIQNGIITYKHIGPIHMNELDERILPMIKGL